MTTPDARFAALLAPALALTLATTAHAQTAHEPASADAQTEITTPAPGPLGGGRIVWGGQRHRVLHFTFDDGPRPDTTGPLLDELDRHGVRATFFVVARQLDPARRANAARRELVREMIRRGHHVGSHTWDHPHLSRLSDAEIVQQIVRSERALAPLIGALPTLFRPPFGEHDARVDRIVEEHGYTEVLWNVTGEPVGGRTEADVLQHFGRMLDERERDRAGRGGIVILHDTRPHVVRAFPLLMEEIARRNCELAAQGEELWTISDDLSPFFEQRRERDPYDRYARRRTDLPEDLRIAEAALRARAAETCEG